MEDFLLVDHLLSDDEKLVRDTVRRFVDEKATHLFADAYEQAKFPRQLVPEIAKLGIFGMTLPPEYGGSGANSVCYGLACQELERGDSGLRSFVSVQNSLSMFPIFQFGTEQQKQKYLPSMARAEIIGCFGLTEADSGSDPSSMRTVAKKVAGGWVLNGSKMWITNGPIADIAIVWAKTDEGIRGFIVDSKTEGFSANEITKKSSLRASSTGELVMTDCFVDDANYLPGTEIGLRAALSCLNQARYGVAWGVIGAAISCYETALGYSVDRIQFKKPIASFQLIQKDLVDMLNEIVKAQIVNVHLGRLKDEGKATTEMISLAKMNCCREALNIARSARNILGASGISLEYPVIRHLMNLESVFTYEGTDNIHHLIVGKAITGISAF